MGKPKENSDSKRKRKRVAVESSSDDDESEQDLEEVNAVCINVKVFLRTVEMVIDFKSCCLRAGTEVTRQTF